MAHGNLAGTVVNRNFWPACHTCRHFAACQVQPRHPAYPHTWHWGRDFASFPEGALILRSWVGTSAIGQPHTGCHSYEVDPVHISDPQPHHHRYLALEYERHQLDTRLTYLEQRGTLSTEAAGLYDALVHRFLEITQEQRALRGPDEVAASAAA